MAWAAHGDQVLFNIVASLAAKLLMVNFEMGQTPAHLAPPTIAVQNSFSELVVGTR